MAMHAQWTVERYKDFEFWLSDPRDASRQSANRKWQCELRIIPLASFTQARNVIVRTIYPRLMNSSSEDVYASAFVESLRVCDEILDEKAAA